MRDAGRILQIAIAAAFCVGLWDGALAALRVEAGLAGVPGIAASGAMLALVGLAVGIPLAAAVIVFRRAAEGLWNRAPSHAALPDGTFQASLLVILSVLTGIVLGVLLLALQRALTFDETQVALGTVLFAVGIVLVLGIAVAVPLAVFFAIGVARTVRLAALPSWRVWRVARCALAIVLVSACAFFITQHGEFLGRATLGVYALMIAAPTQWLASTARPGRLASRVLLAVPVAAAGCLAASAQGLRASPDANRVVSESFGAGVLASWLRATTDFDDDGESSLFGGGDCAPFDAERTLSVPGPPDGGGDRCLVPGDVTEGGELLRPPPVSGLLPEEQVQPYNVVLIVVDALRADRLMASGYSRRLTPEIERLAAEGVAFSNAWSQSSATRVSFPSFLTGRIPAKIHWKKTGRRYGPGESDRMLQEQLTQDYATGFIANTWFKKHLPSLLRGFDEFVTVWFDQDYRRWRKDSAPVTTARAVDFVAEHLDERFFFVAYYEGPHAPYEDLTHRGLTSFGNSKQDRYDQEVRYADRHVGFLLDYLRSHPDVWDNTVVFITADHGEEFGEHGDRHHGHNCHRTSTHVPLIMRIPGMEPGVVDAPVALVDIVPTVLELLGRSRQLPPLDGRSLFYPALGRLDVERPIHCTLFKDRNPRKSLLQSVRLGSSLLVSPPGGADVELYDTRVDPEEQNDVSRLDVSRPDVERLRALMPAPAEVRFDR